MTRSDAGRPAHDDEPSVEIRPTTRDDLPALVEIYLSSARHHARIDPAAFHVPEPDAVAERLLRRVDGRGETSEYLSAVVDGQVVGSAGIEIWESPHPGAMQRPIPTAEIGVAVLDSHRGRGVGSALMTALEAWAVDHAIERIFLSMSSANDGAIRLYERLGYVPFGQEMRKAIGPASAFR